MAMGRGKGKGKNDKKHKDKKRGAKLDGLMVQITRKAGVDGKLFGSVTNSDIAEALKAQGFDVPIRRQRVHRHAHD